MTHDTEVKVREDLTKRSKEEVVNLFVEVVNNLSNDFHGDAQDRALVQILDL